MGSYVDGEEEKLTPEFENYLSKLLKELKDEEEKRDLVKSKPSDLELEEQTEKNKELEYNRLKKVQRIREIPMTPQNDTGESFQNLDNESHIDVNTRLNSVEISAALVIDEMQNMGVFPINARITHTYKRLKISEGGKGRAEKVQIVTGNREHTAPSHFMDLFKKQERKEDGQIGKPN